MLTLPSLSKLLSSLFFRDLKLSANLDFLSAFSALFRAADSSGVKLTSFSTSRDGALLMFPLIEEFFTFSALSPLDVVGSSSIKTTSLSIIKDGSRMGDGFLDFGFSPLIGDLAVEDLLDLDFSPLIGEVAVEDLLCLEDFVVAAAGNRVFFKILPDLPCRDLDLDLDLAACLSERLGFVELLVLGGE